LFVPNDLSKIAPNAWPQIGQEIEMIPLMIHRLTVSRAGDRRPQV
jgi:hypothetical protein